jgi:hypothetical protein
LEFNLGRRFTERTAGGHCQIDFLTNRTNNRRIKG